MIDGRIRRRRTRLKTKWLRQPELPAVGDFVNFSLPAGWTHADMVQKIAEQCGWRVEPLPEKLTQNHTPRGRTVFGSAREILKQIVGEHENLDCAVEDGTLRFEIRDARKELRPSLSNHDRGVWEVIQRGSRGAQYLRELHAAGLRPRKSWREHGCPSTYTGIAIDDDPKWRQRAQDEKSKIRRKAEDLH